MKAEEVISEGRRSAGSGRKAGEHDGRKYTPSIMKPTYKNTVLYACLKSTKMKTVSHRGKSTQSRRVGQK